MLISQQNPVIYFKAYQCAASLILKLPVTHLPFGFCSYASLFQSKTNRDFDFCVISLGYSLLSTADLMKNCSPWSHVFEQLVPVFWCCLGRLWNLQEAEHCWRKNITEGWGFGGCSLTVLPVLALCFNCVNEYMTSQFPVSATMSYSCYHNEFYSSGTMS